MDSKIIDGREIAKKHEEVLGEKLFLTKKTPRVVSILIGDDPPSVLYTNLKKKKAEEVGIEFIPLKYSTSASFEEVVSKIKKLNEDKNIHGIMVQLPIPEVFLKGHAAKELLELIEPKKDIDGLTSKRLVPPAAAKACLQILDDEEIKVEGKDVVVLGASDLVGKPVAELMEKRGAKVILCDSQTEDLEEKTKRAEIIVCAVGKPGMLTGEMVSEGVVIIDIGAEKVGDKTLGDAEFESVYPKASKITPIPGGVGPITIICLMESILELMNLQS